MKSVLLFALRSCAFVWSVVVYVLVFVSAVALLQAPLMANERAYDASLLVFSASFTAPVLYFGTQDRYLKIIRPAEFSLILLVALPICGLVVLMLAMVLASVVGG